MQTPLTPRFEIDPELEASTESAYKRQQAADFPYRQLIGCALYVAIGSMPSISHAVSYLSKFNGKQSYKACKALIRLWKFIFNFKDFYLVMHADPNDYRIRCFCDSNWAGDIETRRSTFCLLIYIGNTLIIWIVRLQDRVAQSTHEAEYLALAPAANQIVSFRELGYQLGIVYNFASVIYCDNQSAIATAENPVHRGKSKHIPIKYHLIREIAGYGVIQIVWIKSGFNLADIGTKAEDTTLFVINNGRIYSFRSFKYNLPYYRPVAKKDNSEYV